MPDRRQIPKWGTLKGQIYRRDKGICWACGTFVTERRGEYHLGHIIDFDAGGSSEPDNLAVFCAYCNLTKPQHKTREEADKWRSYGGNVGAAIFRWLGLCYRGQDAEFHALCEAGEIDKALDLLQTVDLPELPGSGEPHGWLPLFGAQIRDMRIKDLRLEHRTKFTARSHTKRARTPTANSLPPISRV